MKFIKKLQEKSRSARILILWLATIVFMMIVVAVWLFSFSRNSYFHKAEERLEKTKLPSLFDSIGKDFSAFKQTIEEGIEGINNIGTTNNTDTNEEESD